MDNTAGKIIIGTEIDTKTLEKQLKQLEKEQATNFEKKIELETDEKDIQNFIDLMNEMQEKELAQATTEEEIKEVRLEYKEILDMANKGLQLNNQELENINQKLRYNREQQEEIVEKIKEANKELKRNKNLQNMEGQLSKIGNSVSKIVKKIVGWGIALFGIRTAYSAIRSAINIISSQDEQLKADINYMKNALAYTLEPIIRKIVELARQLMMYIGYIIYKWTGKNIFENANKSLQNTNKEATKLSKTLAGFDEMNILNDNSTGGGGGTLPSFDLTNPEQIDPPKWLTWIVEHKNEILSILAGIAGFIEAMKLGLSFIKSLGIGILIGGIVYAIQELIKYLKDPSFEHFGGIIQGIGIALLGLALIIGNIPVAVAGAILLIVGTITKYWEDIKIILQNGIDWLRSKGQFIQEKFGYLFSFIYDTFVGWLQLILNWFDKSIKQSKYILDQLIAFIKNVFTGNWKNAWENLKNIFKGSFESMASVVQLVFDMIKTTINVAIEKIKSAFEKAVEFIKNLFYSLLEIVNNITGKINDAVSTIKNKVSNAKSTVGNFFGGIGSNVKDFFGFSKGGIVVPKLASGGIINKPNRGVPIGSAIGGEHGMEGVIPLTDAQQMAMLGEMIGRYITINANIVNTMNGRVISRELQQIKNGEDFAFNR